jgi:hypothetical protein
LSPKPQERTDARSLIGSLWPLRAKRPLARRTSCAHELASKARCVSFGAISVAVFTVAFLARAAWASK